MAALASPALVAVPMVPAEWVRTRRPHDDACWDDGDEAAAPFDDCDCDCCCCCWGADGEEGLGPVAPALDAAAAAALGEAAAPVVDDCWV